MKFDFINKPEHRHSGSEVGLTRLRIPEITHILVLVIRVIHRRIRIG